MILEASSHASLYDIDVAEKYEIRKSLIAKWRRNRDALENTAAQRHKKLLKKISPSSGAPSEVNRIKSKSLENLLCMVLRKR